MVVKITVGNSYIYEGNKCRVMRRKKGYKKHEDFVVVQYSFSSIEADIPVAAFRAKATLYSSQQLSFPWVPKKVEG